MTEHKLDLLESKIKEELILFMVPLNSDLDRAYSQGVEGILSKIAENYGCEVEYRVGEVREIDLMTYSLIYLESIGVRNDKSCLLASLRGKTRSDLKRVEAEIKNTFEFEKLPSDISFIPSNRTNSFSRLFLY